ncbi:MAG TPA: IPT/TIG domain-containing protein [Thermoanaerobaculia bacterium]|nr:IPT/TIG domain-containing protein [Thermoanaerobaculia bacterium]
MDALRNAPRRLFALILATALALALSCTSSPTEPKGGGTPQSPKPPEPAVSFNITVTANPPEITAGTTNSSNISVSVVRADTGQAPADGSLVHVTTTLGVFGSANGSNAVDLQLVGGHAAATLFATTETGTAAVSATFSGSTGATNVRIGQAATFFVSSVSPNLGNPSGGEQVTILGGGFVAPVRVTFGGAAATVKSVSSNAITVITPSAASAGLSVGVGQTAAVGVQVTINLNKVNQAVDTLDRGFTYALGGGTQQPTVFSVTPALGSNDGGTTVTIIGDGFEAPVQVLFGHGTSAAGFNGVEATITSVTPTRIVAVTPAARGFGQTLINQVVDLLVKNVNTGFSGVASQVFKYGTSVQITAMSQGSGPASGGTRVAIDGSGFSAPVAVSFAFSGVSVAQQVVSVSGSQIVILTSPAPPPATCPANGLISSTAVSVTNISTGDGATANIGFNFAVATPAISGVNPTSGSAGTPITIAGSGFTSSSQVVFGDASSGITVVPSVSPDGRSITVTVPTEPLGFFPTQACGTGGTMSLPTNINITVTNPDTHCTSTFRNGFTLNPPDSSCRNQTPPPPPPAPVASFTFSKNGLTVQFVDTSTGSPTSWNWQFFDGGATSTAQNPTHTFSAPGTYAVKLTVSNANGSSFVVNQVTVP